MDESAFEWRFSDTCSRGGFLELWIEDLWNNKIFQIHKLKVESTMKFDQMWRLLKYVSNS